MEFIPLFHAEVPVPALWLLLDLEQRGCTFRIDLDQGALWITPVALVTNDERALVRRYKLHLLHLLSHCDLPQTSAGT